MPSITIQDLSPRAQYVVSPPSQAVFVYDFPIFDGSDLNVYLYNPATTEPNDVSQLLTYIVDYTVQGVNNPNGGTITLTTAAPANYILTIVRNMPDERLNYYINTAITADALNTDFESDVMMIQQNTMYNKDITPHYNLDALIVPLTDTILPILPANFTWVKDPTDTFITTAEIPLYPVKTINGNTGTMNHVTRWLAPQTIQDSTVILDDGGNFSDVTSITGLGNLPLMGTAGNFVVISGLSYPNADGPAGYVLATNGSGTISFQPGGAPSQIPVDQPGNGFVVGNVVRLSGTTYVLAQADSLINAEAVGIVSKVVDANNFIITLNGLVSGLSALTPGQVYFLSPSVPGALSPIDPTTPGDVEKPMLIPNSTTSGYLINYRGKVIPSPTPATNLELTGNSLISTNTNGPIDLVPNGTGQVFVSSILNMNADNPIRWYNTADTFYSAFKANGTLASSTTWTLPIADGSAGEFLSTDGAGNLSFAPVSGSGVTYSVVTGNTVMAANTVYIANSASLITFTLPASATAGTLFGVVGYGSGGWAIDTGSGQTIYFGSTQTTTGIGGSLASTKSKDSIEFVCAAANTDFVVNLGPQGNITVV